MKTKTKKIVEVTWFDAQSSMDIFTMEDIEAYEPLLSTSIGYLLSDKKTHIVLGFLVFGDNAVKHLQTIPRGMIEKIEVIRDEK